MNPEYDPSAKSEVIYDDNVALASSYNVEILIVKHVDQNCLEIFAFDPRLRKESNRLYVNSRKVRSKLNRKDVEERASSLQPDEVSQEEYLEHLNQVTTELTVEFLLNRIHGDPEALASSRCVIFLSSAEKGTADPLIAHLASNDTPVFQYIVKPEGVSPFVLNRGGEEVEVNQEEEDPESSPDEFNSEYVAYNDYNLILMSFLGIRVNLLANSHLLVHQVATVSRTDCTVCLRRSPSPVVTISTSSGKRRKRRAAFCPSAS